MTPDSLISQYRRNTSIVERQCQGLTHEQALFQAPYNINCMNWVVGHILVGRDSVLNCLGAAPIFTEFARTYLRESEKIIEDGPGVAPLEVLIALMIQSGRQLGEALASTNTTLLQEEDDEGHTLLSKIRFDLWHETYHTGQTDLLRQISGMDDHII